MTSRFPNPKHRQTRLRPARLAIAGLAALIAAEDHAGATSGRSERSVESIIESRTAGEPIMAIVSLSNQRITVYDANGWILRASVSSGQKGRETPAGIFSVIQKEAEHYSNLYEDGYMPHMQRITWSGIALHGGLLPGYPASHGCVRMPFDFAARLFDATPPFAARFAALRAPGSSPCRACRADADATPQGRRARSRKFRDDGCADDLMLVVTEDAALELAGYGHDSPLEIGDHSKLARLAARR